MPVYTPKSPWEAQLAQAVANAWISLDEFERVFLPQYRNGIIDEKGDYKERTLWQKIKSVPSEALTSFGKGLYDVGAQLSRLAPWDQSADPTSFYRRTKDIEEAVKQERRIAWQDPDSLASMWGEFLGEALPTLPVGAGLGSLTWKVWAGIAWSRLWQFTGGIASKVPWASRVSQFAWSKLGQNMWTFARYGGSEQLAYDLMTEWKTSVWSVALGAWFGAALPLAWAGITWAYRWVKSLPWAVSSKKPNMAWLKKEASEKLIESSIKINKSKAQGFRNINNGESYGNFMLKRGIDISNPERTAINLQEKSAELFRTKIWEAAKIQETFVPNKNMKLAVKKVRDWFDVKDASPQFKKMYNYYDNLYKKNDLYINEWMDVLQRLDGMNLIYKTGAKLGDIKAGKNVGNLKNIRTGSRKWIVENSKKAWFDGVDDLMRETQKMRYLGDAIIDTLDSGGKNNILSLTDYIVAWPSMMAWGAPWAIAGVAAKKIISQPWVKGKLAKMIGGVSEESFKIKPFTPTQKLLWAWQDGVRGSRVVTSAKMGINKPIALWANRTTQIVPLSQPQPKLSKVLPSSWNISTKTIPKTDTLARKQAIAKTKSSSAIAKRALEKGGKETTIPYSELKVDKIPASNKDVMKYRRMIQAWDEIDTPVVTANGTVVDGNHRVIAMKAEWIDDIPVIQVPKQPKITQTNKK